MTDEQFNIKKQQGFNEDVINKHFSIIILMMRVAEQFNEEVKEYLAEYKMYTMDLKRELNGIEGRIKAIANKINPVLKDSLENKLNFFEDYDRFLKTIEDFRDGEE